MTYYGANKQQYQLNDIPIKKGGEGAIHTVQGKSNLLAKIYLAPAKSPELQEKITLMVKNPPKKDILDQIAWPIDTLSDAGGNFVGFVMPKLSIDVELGDVYKYPAKKNITLTGEQKVIIAVNICRVISAIHDLDYVFGDFNPCNIGVNLTNGHVAFLDTDSYHITDKTRGKTYRCNVCLNGYVAPELIKKCKNTSYSNAPLPTFTKETDLFSLAIHVFKLLMNGFTPYNGIPENERSSTASPGVGNAAIEMDHYCFKAGNRPLSVAVLPLQAFPNDIQMLFTRAFDEGHQNPSRRPSANEWDKALTNYLANLSKCSNNPMHFHYKGLQACPYCEADQRYHLNMSMSSVYGTNSGSAGQISFSQPMTPPPTNNYSSNTSQYTGSVFSGNGSSQRPVSKRKTNGFSKKFAILISCICVLLIIGVGVYSGMVAGKIKDTMALIDELPEAIKDYSLYDQDISEAYSSYMDLTEHQQGFVKNSDKLFSVMSEYDQYKISVLKNTATGISVDTVSATTALQDAVSLYTALTQDQKKLLSDQDIDMFDNYVIVADVINRINTINSNLVDNYDTLNDALKQYALIDSGYTQLVYNYDLIDGFHETMGLYKKLSFAEVEGGYSVAVAENVELEGEFIIPQEYNGYDVVSITSKGFANQRKLTSIICPDTLTSIGSEAFTGCNRLETITVPFVGGSLSSNSKLTYVFGNNAVPQSLKKVVVTVQDQIVDSAFVGCNHIEQVYYLKELDYIGTSCFSGCEALTTLNSETAGTINLSGSMDKIGDSAFKNCESIQYIVFSDEILSIGNSSFSGCNNIIELNLTNRLVSIGDYAFQGLKKITDVTVYNSTETIGIGAFKDCTSLESVIVPFIGRSGSTRQTNVYYTVSSYVVCDANYESVLGYIFGYTSQRISNDDHSISGNFVNQSGIEEEFAIWQYSCYTGGWDMFCTWGNNYLSGYYYYIPSSLKTITITNQTDIPSAAFNGCTMLEKITFTNGISSQGECAFQNCTATIVDGTESK